MASDGPSDGGLPKSHYLAPKTFTFFGDHPEDDDLPLAVVKMKYYLYEDQVGYKVLQDAISLARDLVFSPGGKKVINAVIATHVDEKKRRPPPVDGRSIAPFDLASYVSDSEIDRQLMIIERGNFFVFAVDQKAATVVLDKANPLLIRVPLQWLQDARDAAGDDTDRGRLEYFLHVYHIAVTIGRVLQNSIHYLVVGSLAVDLGDELGHVVAFEGQHFWMTEPRWMWEDEVLTSRVPSIFFGKDDMATTYQSMVLMLLSCGPCCIDEVDHWVNIKVAQQIFETLSDWKKLFPSSQSECTIERDLDNCPVSLEVISTPSEDIVPAFQWVGKLAHAYTNLYILKLWDV